MQVAAKYADIDIKSHPQRMKAAGKQQKAAAYYAFNIGDNDGFVIVSGDDSLTELVGYSDSGSFDPDNMPDNMRSWLQAYSGYVASVQAGDSKAKRQQLGNVTTIVVRPFVTTEWNQGEPYDRLTPLLDNGAHCATGCVATAMAQVMKYYEWPERGEGSNSYEYDPYGTLSMDFSQSVYDWENMLDIYSSYYEEGNIVPEYNDGQAGAVAKLMYDCGISVNMMYGGSTLSRVISNTSRTSTTATICRARNLWMYCCRNSTKNARCLSAVQDLEEDTLSWATAMTPTISCISTGDGEAIPTDTSM